MNRFDIKEDNKIIDQGGFWCEACLCGKPKDDQSPDKRYCLLCYDFLLEEAKMLPAKAGKPQWIPVINKRHKENTSQQGLEAKNKGQKVATLKTTYTQILSTVNRQKIKVDKNTPQEVKRGRKKILYPRNLSGNFTEGEWGVRR